MPTIAKITPRHRDLGEQNGVTTLSKTGESIFPSWRAISVVFAAIDPLTKRQHPSAKRRTTGTGRPVGSVRARTAGVCSGFQKLSRLWYHWTETRCDSRAGWRYGLRVIQIQSGDSGKAPTRSNFKPFVCQRVTVRHHTVYGHQRRTVVLDNLAVASLAA